MSARRTVLLTIGRMPKGLDVARGFAAAGHRVIVADPHRWHICRVSRAVAKSVRTPRPVDDPEAYRQALREVIAREGVDLVVPISEETMFVVGLEGTLPPGVELFAMSHEHTHVLHDKRRFNALAASLGLPVPPTAVLGTDEAIALAAEMPTVVKPIWSCGGAGVQFVARGAVPTTDLSAVPALVQGRVDGRHLSTCTVARDGRVLGTAVYRGTVMSGTVSVVFQRVDDAPAVHEWVERFVAETGHTGFISFDFIVPDDGVPRAIECNPRVTSGVHFLDVRTVADAITGAADRVTLRNGTRFQHGYATLMEWEGALLKGRPWKAAAKEMFTSRDVVWSLRDPLPFLLMTPVSYEVLAPSLFGTMSMGEAATHDIAWTGPAEAGSDAAPARSLVGAANVGSGGRTHTPFGTGS